jgi:hypothetical protein
MPVSVTMYCLVGYLISCSVSNDTMKWMMKWKGFGTKL